MRDAPPAAPLLPPIEIGVAVDRLYIRIPKRNFVVGLGSVDPDSGFDLALEAAHASDMQLVLSGEVPATAEARSYFQDVIRPRLDQRRRFLGPIGFARKRWMLGAARCLISPRRSVEPTSLAALEALACGTPVVGYPAGPLPGIVEPGVTGFLAEDVEGFVKAVEAAATIDPDACRAAARTRHSIDVMAERYLTLYDDLAMGREPAVGVA
ncbi:glycosyltransferase [Azospirillum thermophilum]|uniref:Uncharacterized protein n=1 Tax=Azospirillum thermophilum TaxID=2202148 RepID=A0A2S2CR56_9PROT|nr:glycosyltransferase [Azospirillum thermophilum]AWK86968.1 hypothetical protein DEW08_12675 [Azospirillum thermophilum]